MTIIAPRQKSLLRYLSLVFVLMLMVTMPVQLLSANSLITTADEPKLRAAIVLGILRFTDWPDDVPINPNLHMCTIGQPMSEKNLLSMSGQQLLQDLAIESQKLNNTSDGINDCHILVIGKAVTDSRLSELLNSEGAHGLLTICDDCQRKSNAMVKLIRKQNRIGFEINLIASTKQGLTFSSSMLELATKVEQE